MILSIKALGEIINYSTLTVTSTTRIAEERAADSGFQR